MQINVRRLIKLLRVFVAAMQRDLAAQPFFLNQAGNFMIIRAVADDANSTSSR